MIDFIIYKESDVKLKVYDYTLINPLTVSPEITSWKLEVSSSKMEEIKYFDIIDYIYNLREENELYIITPELLGFEDIFTDGLYQFKVDLNVTDTKTIHIILYTNIYKRYKELLTKYNYTFEISSVGYISYVDDCDNSGSATKTEEIRILSGLIDQLENYKFLSYTDAVLEEINDIIDKAERIAEILENNN